MPVLKKLTKHGNSLALVLDKPVLDLIDIDADTPLEITTDGQVLIIAPVRDERRKKAFRAALERTNQAYSRALKRLAE